MKYLIRNEYLDKIIKLQNTPDIKVITGMRRSGKSILLKEFIDYVLMGHYHSSKQKVFEGCNVIVNSSIVGPEQYAFSKRLFGKASQKLLIFEGDNFYNMDIYLN